MLTKQVNSLSSRGLSTACIISSSEDDTRKKVKMGDYQLVFFSPELLLTKCWREVLLGPVYSKRLRALVVDEAHTVKKW